MPQISALLPVFNGEKYLKEAILSILEQRFSDFELLIINDGSKDNSLNIILSFQDPRIRLINHTENRGLIQSLNEGISLANGKYIARMDADDISMPHRFSTQFKYMEENPDVGVCGSFVQVIGTGEEWRMPVEPEEVKCRLFLQCCMAHPTVMIRKKVLDEYNVRYDPDYIHAEDYKMWTELVMHCKLVNLPEVLLYYRLHENQITKQFQNQQLSNTWRTQIDQLHRLGVRPSKKEALMHWDLCFESYKYDHNRVDWIKKLILSNKKSKVYDPNFFNKMLTSYQKVKRL